MDANVPDVARLAARGTIGPAAGVLGAAQREMKNTTGATIVSVARGATRRVRRTTIGARTARHALDVEATMTNPTTGAQIVICVTYADLLQGIKSPDGK
jgi:hypothetical protein